MRFQWILCSSLSISLNRDRGEQSQRQQSTNSIVLLRVLLCLRAASTCWLEKLGLTHSRCVFPQLNFLPDTKSIKYSVPLTVLTTFYSIRYSDIRATVLLLEYTSKHLHLRSAMEYNILPHPCFSMVVKY